MVSRGGGNPSTMGGGGGWPLSPPHQLRGGGSWCGDAVGKKNKIRKGFAGKVGGDPLLASSLRVPFRQGGGLLKPGAGRVGSTIGHEGSEGFPRRYKYSCHNFMYLPKTLYMSPACVTRITLEPTLATFDTLLDNSSCTC
jgi:hypothetical protein